MTRSRWLVLLAALVVLLGTTSLAHALESAAPPARLSLTPSRPYALEPAKVVLRTTRELPAMRVRVRAHPASGSPRLVRTALAGPRARTGTFRFPTAGAWRLVVTDPTGRPVSGAAALVVRVRAPRATAPPEGFGALGKPGCDPPSPASGSVTGLRDIFGTALGGEELWALPFLPAGASWPTPHFAVFDELVGKEIKIVFAMSAFRPPFWAIGPGGQELEPVWGPSFHKGSNWIRQPGSEWGAGFVFPEPGCWEVRVGARGSVFFLIRS